MLSEKRKTKRIPVQVPAGLIDQDGKAGQGCAVMDISPDGIGLLLNLNQALEEKRTLNFVVDIPPGKVLASGKVMWVRGLQKSKPYNYAAGLKLSEAADTGQSRQTLLDYARSLAGRYVDQTMEPHEL